MSSKLRTLQDFGVGYNVFSKILTHEAVELSEQFRIREVRNAHFTFVKPEPVPAPYMIAASDSCAEQLQLDPKEFATDRFIQAFSGNYLLPGLDRPWATTYGCHCFGSWFGQMGDGRAMSIGEVSTAKAGGEDRFELQLKGCGRTPFSRGFDGRAVVRSSIREFLMSEAMHHLGVSTTRALCVVGTGATVIRPWYASKSNSPNNSSENAFPPNMMQREPGAVLCRVSKTFVRFAHLELLAKRQEYEQLIKLTDFVIMREYPDLLVPEDVAFNAAQEVESIQRGSPARYVNLFRAIAQSTSRLVVNWIRVGYVQGNMNSDNTHIGGRTIDYGPFGVLEQFDHSYQPFTSDGDGKFSFSQQPQAMQVNVFVLGDAFSYLIKKRCEELGLSSQETEGFLRDINTIRKSEFGQYFRQQFDNMRRCKLGLDSFGTQEHDLHSELEQLMYASNVDYTILYRELGTVNSKDSAESGLSKLVHAFYNYDKSDKKGWISWLDKYIQRIKYQESMEDGLDATARKALMDRTNPKFILRNWMSTLAYETATNGESEEDLVMELFELLKDPYAEQPHRAEKWYQRTPHWAQGMPGVAFLS